MTRIIWKFYDYKIPRFERLLWEATTSRQTGTCEMRLVPSALLTASILSSATLRAGGDMESIICNIYFSSFQYHRGAAGRHCFPHKRRNLGQFWPSGKSQLNPDQWNIWVCTRGAGWEVLCSKEARPTRFNWKSWRSNAWQGTSQVLRTDGSSFLDCELCM